MTPRIRDRARTHAPALLMALALASGCGAPATETPAKGPDEPVKTTPTTETTTATTPPAPKTGCAVLSINDTYRIEPLPGGKGGMARVRTIRKELEKKYPDLVVLHAGDMLFPSLISQMYKGRQMIEAVSRLDGGPGQDARLFAAFGNHEFDKDDPAVISSRVAESEFRWLSANVHFKVDDAGKSAVNLPEGKVLPRTIVPCGPLKLGLFGVTIGADQPYIAAIHDPAEAARVQTAALRKEGADVVVALTHLSMTTDRGLLEKLGAEGPDVILGGHEHQKQKAAAGERVVYKADADAVSANVLTIDRSSGNLRISHEWVPLEGAAVPEDPEMKAWVDGTLKKHEDDFCAKTRNLPAGSGCLSEVLGAAGEDLIAEELEIRRFETNLGNWILDQALAAFPKEKKRPQIAFINSGTLRINLNLPKGEPITTRNIEELFAYPAILHLIEINGETLQKVVNHSIENWTGEGHFLQIAGFAFEHDTTAKTASKLTLLGAKPKKIGPKDVLYAVTIDYMVDPKGKKDGYSMLGSAKVIAKGPDIKQVVLDRLAALKKENKPLAPKVDGRICNTERKGVCQVLP
ncbi:bifunctional metallophosphatase/5'-nucleotidase [Polyangium jinanense]|uniref:Bifunctional metallophosphatase/5'-nucleotidase n=1 Tax=Polyangium jinanense TaxID=2829994 RepID=A0A9X3WXI4_9BACT|nr:bifunctional metallophosphatase/5'-nucleotidase [Polyangium jinanense]MDC3952365.1 bifunctional metallophosphatase/5'-nucleotidase [Polyangium jinanense]MDC3979994.1 bifunctional metallophosphatase/5'-nucleotidase [Polyangium jinanense]